MADGERVITVVLAPADGVYLDRMAGAGGWRDLPTLVRSLVHELVEDDRATERDGRKSAA